MKNILVTGSHRSGTTWVGKTIAQHSNVQYIQEPFNVNHPNAGFKFKSEVWFEHYFSSERKDEIKFAFDSMFGAGSLGKAQLRISDVKSAPKSLFLFLAHYINCLTHPMRLLVKDPLALFSAGWLYEEYDLDVICMIRSPVAFVGSLKKAGWDFDFDNLLKQELLMKNLLTPFSDDIRKQKEGHGDIVDRASLLWNILHYAILEYKQQYPSWLFVKYEDIAGNPVKGFDEIFDHLGLDVDRNITAYIKKFTSQDIPIKRSSSLYSPRDSKLCLDTWKQRLTNEEIDRVNCYTKDIASQLYD